MRPRTIMAGVYGIKPLPDGAILGHHQRKSKARADKFHAAREAASRIVDADSSILDRAEHLRGYAGPLYGGTTPEGGLVEIEMGDGYVLA